MTSHTRHYTALRVLSSFACATTLVACGGGSESADATLASSGTTPLPVSTSITSDVPAVQPNATGVQSAVTAALVSRSLVSRGTTTNSNTMAITDVRLESTDSATIQGNVPVTFGQVFAVGALPAGATLSGQLEDGTQVPLQLDVKATHADGSVRHAVVSAMIPKLGAGSVRTLSLLKSAIPATPSPVTPANALNSGFSAAVQATINGVRYSVSADSLLKKAGAASTWLSGSVANEWHVDAPLVSDSGVAHPHLSARFAIRWYEAIKRARVDVTVENNWAYEPAPQNFTYDATVTVGGAPVYTKQALTHYHHARWRKVFWSGGSEPLVHVKHNTNYLIASRALPNYDQSLTIPETSLAAFKSGWTGAAIEPMGIGMAIRYMPSTGGRNDLGLLPGWAASYLLSMDKRAKEVTLGTADLAGSWSSHYRDKNTDRPVSLIDYPYMTILGRSGDTKNPKTGQYEAFPKCGGSCDTPYTHDSSHQPAFAYLPYLVTGDYYYLEELQFWTMWNLFSSNPGYREHAKALVHRNQVRGQAWTLRSLGEAAYITPDNDPLKSQFNTFLSNNLEWYTQTFVKTPATSNALGVLTSGAAVVYNDDVGVGPWQDDFFTSAIGHIAELGFTQAMPLLQWKAQFPILRMNGPGACWIGAANYTLNVRATPTSPLYSTIGEAYQASQPIYTTVACASAEMASLLKLKVGEMTGYSSSATGFPSNLQPALAYSADVGGTAGKTAWSLFIGRSVKPDYSKAPQFAVVPR